MMKKIWMVIFLIFLSVAGSGEQLPRPNYDNSVIVAMIYDRVPVQDEVNAIKALYGHGIFTPLYFSHFIGIHMDWSVDPAQADTGISGFKAEINNLVQWSQANEVGLHMCICYGLARRVTEYNAAKSEDMRNAMWFNDNNLAAADQVTTSLNQYVFATFSRYARKLRRFHEAKITAMADFLTQVQANNPLQTIVFSGPGEAEMNFNRLGNVPGQPHIQTYFCDYSPFAILEFRDWIQHAGLYAPGEKYAGQGCENGGSQYQGSAGLQKFNADFATAFSSWDLKYYNWSLSDPVDTDPGALPFSGYAFNSQLPESGDHFIAGGFDAPRQMQPLGSNDFYDLWHAFREQMVANYVKDMAGIVRASGFPKHQFYTHQIPADYLFGKQPSSPYKDPRYYSSASPMWTADAFDDIGMGITLYDVKIGSTLYETTKYAVAGISSMSGNWAALEFNPEVTNDGAVLSPLADLEAKFMDLYDHHVHGISNHKWLGDQYAFKDTNRGTALLNFINKIKDKARQPLFTVFSPPGINGLAGVFSGSVIDLTWSSLIWPDLTHTWNKWGDFKEFVLYRGYTDDFVCNPDTEVTRTASCSYSDTGYDVGRVVYYKIQAVNKNNVAGPESAAVAVIPSLTPKAILNISRNQLNFSAAADGTVTSAQNFYALNEGEAELNWTAVPGETWIILTPASGRGTAKVTVSVNPAGLAAGNYSGTVVISDPGALNSPRELTIKLTKKNATNSPFGNFTTPVNDSTVRSSVPVTGWALDDLEVKTVKIYRETPTDLAFIGDAVFVEGARPDVEAKYPAFPLNYRAGWGYMLLTYGLPDKGMDNDFMIHVIATDAEGNETDLGSKLIHCDNQNAVEPFGAIDRPFQGGEASGSYINWGWALTPNPNSIPSDGSTINVIVDGVILGHPVYNLYRADIATRYPGYANTDGAVGHFTLDTTAYANGTHTISWQVTDNAGHVAGLGSRFFTVFNPSSSAGAAQKNTWLVSSGGNSGTGSEKAVNPELHTLPDAQNNVAVHRVRIQETRRLVLNFSHSACGALAGYMKAGQEQRPLPAGSTLDRKQGIFFWQPGPGFVGTYELVFFNPDTGFRQQVTVEIEPKRYK